MDFQPNLKNILNFNDDHHVSLYCLSMTYAKLEDYPKARVYWFKHLDALSMKQQVDAMNPKNRIAVAMSWFENFKHDHM